MGHKRGKEKGQGKRRERREKTNKLKTEAHKWLVLRPWLHGFMRAWCKVSSKARKLRKGYHCDQPRSEVPNGSRSWRRRSSVNCGKAMSGTGGTQERRGEEPRTEELSGKVGISQSTAVEEAGRLGEGSWRAQRRVEADGNNIFSRSRGRDWHWHKVLSKTCNML